VSVDCLLSTQGRLARIAFGTVLILFGLGVVGGFLGVSCCWSAPSRSPRRPTARC